MAPFLQRTLPGAPLAATAKRKLRLAMLEGLRTASPSTLARMHQALLGLLDLADTPASRNL